MVLLALLGEGSCVTCACQSLYQNLQADTDLRKRPVFLCCVKTHWQAVRGRTDTYD